jgi:NTP pyrophosphatase (non-canonical NTP hydrolase)
VNLIETLALAQLEQHVVDRYPTVEGQFLKLIEEVGELSKELNRREVDVPRLRHELADVVLCVFNLSRKLGIDLERAVSDVVRSDRRVFT